MQKYDVHIFGIARVKVANVEAESQQKAIEQVIQDEQYSLWGLFPTRTFEVPKDKVGIECAEYAEEHAYYLVDEQGDEEYANSTYYDSKLNLMVPPKTEEPDKTQGKTLSRETMTVREVENAQDAADNAIFDLITKLNPSFAWDIKVIGAVRDLLVEKIGLNYP